MKRKRPNQGFLNQATDSISYDDKHYTKSESATNIDVDM